MAIPGSPVRLRLSPPVSSESGTLIHWGTPPVLQLPPGLAFEPMRALLRNQLDAQRGELDGVSLRMDISSTALALFDLRRMTLFMKDEFHVDVVGLICPPEALARHAERELKLKIHLLMPEPPKAETPRVVDVRPEAKAEIPKFEFEPVKTKAEQEAEAKAKAEADAKAKLEAEAKAKADAKAEAEAEAKAKAEADAKAKAENRPEPVKVDTAAPKTRPETKAEATAVEVEDAAPVGDRVLTVESTVRSGSVITFAGDVHIFGDVNPGAQVMAGGNVIVFGSLKGQVHAGTREAHAFVLAFDMRPTLLRIGRSQTSGTRDPNQTGRFFPEIAWLSQGNIVIEPYKGRLPVKEAS